MNFIVISGRTFAYKVVKVWSNPKTKSSLDTKGWWNGECSLHSQPIQKCVECLKFTLQNSRGRYQWLVCLETNIFLCMSKSHCYWTYKNEMYILFIQLFENVLLLHAWNLWRPQLHLCQPIGDLSPMKYRCLWWLAYIPKGLHSCIRDWDIWDSLHSYILSVWCVWGPSELLICTSIVIHGV